MNIVNKHNFQPLFDDLLVALRAGWTWPSPEVGFARHVFERAGEMVPVAFDDPWPLNERLDHAPILAATGYFLTDGSGRVIRPDWQKRWAAGFERLSERGAFPSDRMSFAFRPLYVLGIALGAAHSPLLTEANRDWVRGVLRRLQEEGSTEPWADLIYGTAALAVGTKWRDQLFVRLGGAAVEVLALLRWLPVTIAFNGSDGLTAPELLDSELLRRCAAGTPWPSEVAKIAVIYHSLRRAVAAAGGEHTDGTDGRNVATSMPLAVRTAILTSASSGVGVTVNLVSGDQHMGDKISMRDNVAGAVGRGAAVVARDITIFRGRVESSPNIEADLKQILLEAREKIERASLSDPDKEDATENLTKLTVELDKPVRDSGLIKRYWNRVKDVAPPVAALLSSAASIAKIIEAVHK